MTVALAYRTVLDGAQRADGQEAMVRQRDDIDELDGMTGIRIGHRRLMSAAPESLVRRNATANRTHSRKSGTAVVISAAAMRARRYSTVVPTTYPSFSTMQGIIMTRYRAGFDAITKNANCHAIATDRNP